MDLTQIGAFPGIYLLIVNGKRYIGSSVNINKRVTEHKRLLRLGKHYNYLLQKEYDISPVVNAFCITECDKDYLLLEEQYYLDKEAPELNLSILAKCGCLSPDAIHKKQGGARNHMAKINIEQAISVVNARLTGATLQEVASMTEVPYVIVVSICSGHNWKKELEEYIPEQYSHMKNNAASLGRENQGRENPRRLFNDEKLIEILSSLKNKETLQSIADRYSTSKTVISSIKNNKVYRKDIKRLLSVEDYTDFLERATCK
jgi:hypothetical protein